MKQNISFSQFTDAFRDYGREDQFSYDALRALYGWIKSYDEDCGTDTELDVISLCCEFTEYADLEEFQDNYNADDFPDIESIHNHTSVIAIDGSPGFIIADF